MAGLTNEERETIVRYDHHDDTIHVYSTERGWWSFCERVGMELVDTQHNRGNVVSRQYLGPHKFKRAGVNLKSALGWGQGTRTLEAGSTHRDATGD